MFYEENTRACKLVINSQVQKQYRPVALLKIVRHFIALNPQRIERQPDKLRVPREFVVRTDKVLLGPRIILAEI